MHVLMYKYMYINLLDISQPVVVGQCGAVHLYPQVARGLVWQQMARVLEVGLDLCVGPQQRNDQVIIPTWPGRVALVVHYPETM